MEKQSSKKLDPTFQEIRQILREVSINQKDTDRRMKETDRRMKENERKLTQMFKDTDRRMKETDLMLKKISKENDRRAQETDQRINKITGDWGNSWGNLAESLTKAGFVKRFREHGVKIERLIENMRTQDTEFDLIGVNGKEVVVVEVKTRLRVGDVPKFIQKLKVFTEYCPEYRGKVVLGGMATFKSNTKAEVVQGVSEAGLFFIDISGDVIIRNSKSFVPKSFS